MRDANVPELDSEIHLGTLGAIQEYFLFDSDPSARVVPTMLAGFEACPQKTQIGCLYLSWVFSQEPGTYGVTAFCLTCVSRRGSTSPVSTAYCRAIGISQAAVNTHLHFLG